MMALIFCFLLRCLTILALLKSSVNPHEKSRFYFWINICSAEGKSHISDSGMRTFDLGPMLSACRAQSASPC